MLYLLTTEGTGNVTVRQTPAPMLRERENDATETLFLPMQNTFRQKGEQKMQRQGRVTQSAEIFDDRNCLRVQSVRLGLDGGSFRYEWSQHS